MECQLFKTKCIVISETLENAINFKIYLKITFLVLYRLELCIASGYPVFLVSTWDQVGSRFFVAGRVRVDPTFKSILFQIKNLYT